MPFINTVHRVSLFYRVEADVMPVNSTGVDTASCISFSAGYEFRRTHPPPVFLLLSAFPADFITRLLWNKLIYSCFGTIAWEYALGHAR